MIESLMFALLLAAIATAGFFAGVETGFLSVSRARLLSLVKKEGRAARRLADILSDMPYAVTTLLVGNNLAAVLASTMAAALADRWFSGSAAAQSAWTIAVALVTLYCGEYLPKLLFATRPLRRSLAAAQPYRLAALFLAPVVAIFTAFVRAVFKVNTKASPKRLGVSRDGLRMLVADRNDATQLTAFERRLIDRVLTLQARFARDLAHPAISHSAGPAAPLRIPASTRGDDILPLMRKRRQPVAVVFDDSTGAELGTVTEEDVLTALFA